MKRNLANSEIVVESADMCAGKFPLVSMGGRAEGLACADPGARTPIGASGFFIYYLLYSLGVFKSIFYSLWNTTIMTSIEDDLQ
jgi:hypothetical protein